MKKIIIILSCFFILNACASSPSPQRSQYDGNYYITGGTDCERWRQISNGTIMCYKSDGETATGYRSAMTQQDMQMYMYQKQQEQIAMQNLQNTMNNLSNSMHQNAALYNQAADSLQSYNQNYNNTWSQPRRKSSYCYTSGNVLLCN